MNNFLEFWKSMDSWKRYAVIAAVLTIIGFAAVTNMRTETYETLYSGLSTNDSKDIIKELVQLGIDYQINEENASILIDGEKIPTVRMKLASMGLPSSGSPGFEILNESSLGATKDEKNTRYQIALKGQIENDLVKGIESIDRATVNLTLVETDSIFEEEETSKATVILGLQNGSKLTASQISGVQNFVAGAVKKLDPKEVVVLSEGGDMLSDETAGSSGVTGSAGYSKQEEIVQQTETRIKNDIMKSLSTIFGYDHVRVNVRAAIDFDEMVSNIEKYDPEGVLVSRQETRENVQKSAEEPVVEPGTDANGDVPFYEIQDGEGDADYSSDSEDIIENFEVGKTVETIKKNPQLSDLNVVVWIDKTMNNNEINRMERAIATAAGIKDLDGDEVLDNGAVEIVPVIFNQNAQNNPQSDAFATGKEGLFGSSKNMIVLVYVAIGAAFVLVSVITWLSVKNKNSKDEILKDEFIVDGFDDNASIYAQGVPGMGTEEERIALKMAESQKQLEKQFELEEQQKLGEEAHAVAEEYPERTADYIKKLISEG